MSIVDLGLIDYDSKTLLIDGDIIVYQPCCVFNEDLDIDRNQIKKVINNKIEKLMDLAGCDKYIMFVTTKTNFRDDLVDDYKLHRDLVDRPVNLAWAKRWSVNNLNTHYVPKLEADDLIGIYQKHDTIIWSLDKDLRQIPGMHLDDITGLLKEVSVEGLLRKKTKGIHFEGTIGLYYQMLVGDNTDYIVGCGKRVETTYKSGAKKGQKYIRRVGVGPMAAYKLLIQSKLDSVRLDIDPLDAALEVVINEYKKLHGKSWQVHLETQANLLFMVREQNGNTIKRWTCDGRDEYFDLTKGVIIHGY